MQHRNFLISAEALRLRLGENDLRIVDCRFNLLQVEAGRNSYLEGHIPSAVYADLDKDLAAPKGARTGRHPLPDVARLSAVFSRLGISPNTSVVAYDDASGALAARTWWLLRWLGHEQVWLLDGGIARWNALGYSLDDGDVIVAAQTFIPTERSELVLRTEEIVAAGDSCAELGLVDAREVARFRGEVEPIDSVAGHIPGALNLPFVNNLNRDGTWKSSAQLQQVWRQVMGEDTEQPLSVMCGSGVTACHLIVSALLAGFSEPRLYVGSWSEWICDPDRHVATGESEKA